MSSTTPPAEAQPNTAGVSPKIMAGNETAPATPVSAPMPSIVPLHTDEQDVPVQAPGPALQEALPLTLSREQRVLLRRIARLVLIAAVAYSVIWLLWTAREALIPFIFGLAIAYVLLPAVNRLAEGVPRWAAILIVYALSVLVIAAAVSYIVPPVIAQLRSLTAAIPELAQAAMQPDTYMNQLQDYLPAGLREPVDQGIRRSLVTIQNNLTTYLSNLGGFVLGSLSRVLDTITFLIGFLVVPFWMFYVLNDHKTGLKAVDNLLPRIIREDIWALARIFDSTFSKYIRGQLFLGLIVGVMSAIGLFALGLFGFEVNYILLLAIFAGFTELIPVIGPIIGAIPAIILGAFDGLGTALAVTVLYVVIQQAENQILVPRIVGKSVGIHPATMFIILAVGAQVFGLLGAILGAPAYAAIRDIVVYLNQRLSDPVETVTMEEITPPVLPPEQLHEREVGA